ncbi:hypothetical protein [Liquorilactobacillus sicerae]|uniref:hypothetical protein n=1 Tax=Liquorilactobacillus sicerae TaxID=1416943 RepID=UPI0024813610|nr:hypothetical protein [Liquorilactobacillus sicerae]
MKLKENFLQGTLLLINYSEPTVIYHKFNLLMAALVAKWMTVIQQLFAVKILKKKNLQGLILDRSLDKPPEFLD